MYFKPESLHSLATQLREGAVGILPFDTLYGLTCTLTEEGVQRIASLKSRDAQKPFIVVVSSLEQAQDLATFNTSLFHQGPITYIAPKRNTPEFLSPSFSTIAIRYPDYTPINMLLHAIGKPLISTSVNVSGEASLLSLSQLSPDLKSKLDFVCDDFTPYYNQASSIIDISGNEQNIIRQGVGL